METEDAADEVKEEDIKKIDMDLGDEDSSKKASVFTDEDEKPVKNIWNYDDEADTPVGVVERLTEPALDLGPGEVEVVVADDDLARALEAIAAAARTGRIGDGKIFISDILDVMRIRTGETGPAAV